MDRKQAGEIRAQVTEVLGHGRFRARSIEGVDMLCREPGRIRFRVRLKPGNWVRVKAWSMDSTRADLVRRYTELEVERRGWK